VADRPPLGRRIAAEATGSFFLFACVIGSGIMAQNLSGGNDAVALLGNTLATGAILFVLITILGPISGAHMNPAVSLVAASRRELGWTDAATYIAAQLAFGILGAWAAHLMFGLPTLQLSVKARHGLGQFAGEFIATFGLILTILGTVRFRQSWVPPTVALYITAAYWFTSSTSFANPAITVAEPYQHFRRNRATRCASIRNCAASWRDVRGPACEVVVRSPLTAGMGQRRSPKTLY
jgi:glycerol uptake facilitator-like aquaporin